MDAITPSWQEQTTHELIGPPRLSLWRTAVTLFKLRVVSLLLLSAFGGAILGALATGAMTVWSLLLLTVSGTLSAAGASAINQYLERERDTHMRRTAARPLPTGQIGRPRIVLWIGGGMVLAATGLAALFNLPLAFWVFMGAVIYVGVYTIWLKPRTILNIVIGGAAGSCAVISGGAAVGAWSALEVWVLAGLVFTWTPVHFWSLALAYREDYARADYPMLPARVTPAAAAWWTALHTAATAVIGLTLGFWPQLDLAYLIPVGLVTIGLLWQTVRLLVTPEKKSALALFHYSNLYLAFLLVIILLASLWR